MDILTQGLVGAVLAQGAARREEVRLAALAGFGAALLADVDFFIHSTQDPLLNLELHRQLTHALIFVPVGGLVAALVLWRFLRRGMSLRRLLVLTTLGYGTAGLLDACTSYGTRLLWPFSDQRVAWNIISIVDPVFTLGLLLLLVWGTVRRRAVFAQVALVLALAYLGLGLAQRERAEGVALALAAERGHAPSRLVVKPTLGNLVLWRSVYQVDGRHYVDAVRVGLAGGERVYPGDSVEAFRIGSAYPSLDAGSVLGGDIRRFERFSDGWLALHPGNPPVLGDLRYSMLPTGTAPLWGLEFNPARPDRHVAFRTYRKFTPEVRGAFIDMLMGRDPRALAVPGLQGELSRAPALL